MHIMVLYKIEDSIVCAGKFKRVLALNDWPRCLFATFHEIGEWFHIERDLQPSNDPLGMNK